MTETTTLSPAPSPDPASSGPLPTGGLEVVSIAKSYDKRAVLTDISLSVAKGEVLGLLGPNGAGKTTTLRMLYTLMQPDRGRVLVDGIDAAADPLSVRQRLGVLPDARGLYKRLSARENIDYFGRLQGLDEATIATRCEALCKALDMDDIMERRSEGFSQGQRVKTAIARALVHDPKNCILDEPTNGLDVMATRAMREFLRHLKSEGRCVLFSSHIMQEVAALCDRVVIIDKGTVVFNGTPDEALAATGLSSLEDAFVKLIGSEEGLFA